MKKFLVSLLEGAIVGVILGVTIVILDIDITAAQTAMIVAIALISTSIASSIGQFISTGKAPVFYEWVYSYGGNRIAVSAGLTEKLYINDELAAQKKGVALKAELKGRLSTGEEVRAVITGGMTAKCEVFVGNKQLQPVATKTS